MNREATCFFTGHRIIPTDKRQDIEKQVENAIEKLYLRGYRSFVCGGAIGFDELCAECVLRLRERLPDIELRLILPCLDQDKYFSARQKESYRRIRAFADRIEVLHQSYTRSCMHDRNRAMCDASSVCVAYCTKATGGTAYTVNYALKNKLPIYKII